MKNKILYILIWLVFFFCLIGHESLNAKIIDKEKSDNHKVNFRVGLGLGITLNDKKTSNIIGNQFSPDFYCEANFKKIFISVLGSYSKTILSSDLISNDQTFIEGDTIKITRAYFYGGYKFDYKNTLIKPNIGYVTNRFGNPIIGSNELNGYGLGLDLDKNIIKLNKGNFILYFKSKIIYNNYSKVYQDLGKFSYYLGLGLGFSFE